MAINPTCSMMLRREWPELLEGEDRARAQRLAAAVVDPSEHLWSIRREPRFNTDFKSSPAAPIAYHAPCHLRAQAIGFRARSLLGKLPGVESVGQVMECCGHNGTYAMTVEGFVPSQRLGKRAFDGMKATDAEIWATDCPLAALQFEQHAGVRPMHPMTLLARAYREDGFVARADEQRGEEER
jgi:Fe-S oxidoreductase